MKESQSKKKLSILLITYNDAQHLEQCVGSIYQKFADKLEWELVLINNDKRQNIQELPLDFSRIKLVDHRENVGFGAGMNLGARQARGEFLLIFNPDTEIISDNILELLEEFNQNKQIGIIGGGILDRQGNREEWSSGKELSFYDLLRNKLGITRSKAIWNSPTPVFCDRVGGTVLFIKKSLFDRVGGFDERFFMYFEDMDLCRRVRKAGKKVLFYPKFKIYHGSGESYTDKRLQKSHYYDSMEVYLKKYSKYFSLLMVKLMRKLVIGK